LDLVARCGWGVVRELARDWKGEWLLPALGFLLRAPAPLGRVVPLKPAPSGFSLPISLSLYPSRPLSLSLSLSLYLAS